MIACSLIFFIFFSYLNIIHSAPAPVNVDNSKTQVVYSEHELNPGGDYYYKYKLTDGQAVDVVAKLKEVNGNQIYGVTGSYTFEGTDGKIYTINYIADENGYKTEQVPQSSSTPRPPPASPIIPISGPPPPVKPGEPSEINSQTLAGIFG